jgi:uncharacterized damage-inducible protein DinB
MRLGRGKGGLGQPYNIKSGNDLYGIEKAGFSRMDYANGPEFLRYFENIRARTTRVVECIPREHLEWRPVVGMFSFADLVRHLAATERFMFGENAQCKPSRYPGNGPELADGYDAVMQYYRRCHEETVEIISRLSADDLQLRCQTPGATGIPVWKWLRSMIEHEVHHRGQIYLMLRMIGVATPALYGLTSEEVMERSVR